MPVIDVNGEKRKVACGPCIRGHRSSKCQHSDRVLIEVRKPGRPLSACPHPAGSCGCQRAVYYTVPKNESSPTPSGPLSPAAGVYSPPTLLPSNRVQKSRLRMNSTSINTSSLQRAFDGDPCVLAQHVSQGSDIGLPTESSESSSDVPSLVSSSSSTPQTEAVDMGMHNYISGDKVCNGDVKGQTSRLRLGMLGIGGHGATSDEVGWTGDWPDYNSIPTSNDRVADATPRGSCCGGSSSLPEPKPLAAPSSCCAPKTSQTPPQQSVSRTQRFAPTQQNGTMTGPFSTDLNFPSHFSLPAPAFNAQPSNTNFFTEDQFGCLHQPDHACQCGAGCECLGCSMHPANRTTTDYVRYHTELTMRGYVDPHRAHIPPSSSYIPQLPHFGSSVVIPTQNLEQGPFQQSAQFVGSAGGGHPQFLPSWQENQHPITTPTLEMSQFSLQRSMPLAAASHQHQQSRPQTSHQATASQQESQFKSPVRQLSLHESNSYDHESPNTEDDASTLSPSAFSVQQFSMPGCNDVTGSCLCGDGCQCEGCLTHNGHGNEAALGDTDVRGESDANQIIQSVSDHVNVKDFRHESFDDILRDPIFSSTLPS